MKDALKSMKHTLIAQTQAQIANLQCADYEELGAAVDMIKDIEEALYYCAITEAMEENKEKSGDAMENTNTYYYTERYLPSPDYYRDIDRYPMEKMYYSGNGSNSSNSSNGSSSSGNMEGNRSSTSQYSSMREYPIDIRDWREGRSPLSRKMYMESKEMHADKTKQLKDLEKYMQELTVDIKEMMENASPEEKQLLQKKMSNLSSTIEQMK